MEVRCSATVPTISFPTGNDDEPYTLQTLSSIRSLVVNDSIPDHSLSPILESLTTSLHSHRHHHNHHYNHHHVLSILYNASLRRPRFSNFIFNSILSLTCVAADSCPRLPVECLSFLLSLADTDTSLRVAFGSLDDALVVSLCFRPCVSVRRWILNNLTRFSIRPNVLVTVLLGGTEDPCPLVRKAALDGLANACCSGIVVNDSRIIEGCYRAAAILLGDMEECVRASAVRAVIEWGKMLVDSMDEADKRDYNGQLFLLLCSVVRDMSLNVRLEGFYALGRVGLVSEDILLQSLSGRVLSSIKEKKTLVHCSANINKLHASSAARAFVHGLEDEFTEVRRASCISLRQHVTLTPCFAGEALTLLLDVCNEDSALIKLEVLKTIQHTITCDCVKVQRVQMPVLLGMLADSSPQIRVEALSILGSMKYADLRLYNLSVESLLDGMENHPQNEAKFLLALFKAVQINGGHAVSTIQDVCHKIKSTAEESGFDRPRVIGLVVMAVSTSFNHEAYFLQMPSSILSYTAVYFGRISVALSDLVDKSVLLACLSSRGGSAYTSKGELVTEVEGNWLDTKVNQLDGPTGNSSPQASAHVSANWSSCLSIKCCLQASVEIRNSIKFSFASIAASWELIKSGRIRAALEALRSSKEGLTFAISDPLDYAGTMAFGLQYIRVIKLLAMLWEHHFLSQKNFDIMGRMNLALVKIDMALLELRHRFMGFTKDDELHLLELSLLGYVLRVSRFQVNCKTMNKLTTTVSRVVGLCEASSLVPSEFVKHLAKISQGETASITKVLCSPLHLMKLLDSFYLKDYGHLDRLRHKKAELLIPGYSAENPFTFVPGLPVGIPLEVSIHNAMSEDQLWVKLSVDEFSEFIYLDLDEQEDCEVMRIGFIAPFYKTPTVVAFTLRISIAMECLSEDFCPAKVHGGPKHPLAQLSLEREVYFILLTQGA